MKYGSRYLFLIHTSYMVGEIYQVKVKWDGAHYFYCGSCNGLLRIQSMTLSYPNMYVNA